MSIDTQKVQPDEIGPAAGPPSLVRAELPRTSSGKHDLNAARSK